MAVSRVLSIEITDLTTHICEIGYNKKNPVIYKSVIFENPQYSIEDGFVLDRVPYKSTLKEVLNNARVRSRDVVFCLSSSKIINREITIPEMKEELISGLIENERDEYFPMDTSGHVFAYEIIERIKETKQLRISVYAAPEILIRNMMTLAAEMEFNVVAIDYAGNAVQQWLKRQTVEPMEMYLQINEKNSQFTIMDNGMLELQRNMNFGVNTLVNAMNDGRFFDKDLEYNEALLKMKNDRLLFSSFEEADAAVAESDEERRTFALRARLTDATRPMIGNLTSVLEYYNTKKRGAIMRGGARTAAVAAPEKKSPFSFFGWDKMKSGKKDAQGEGKSVGSGSGADSFGNATGGGFGSGAGSSSFGNNAGGTFGGGSGSLGSVAGNDTGSGPGGAGTQGNAQAEDKPAEPKMSRIYVGGVGTKITGLKELIENEFNGIEVVILDKLPGLNIAKDNIVCQEHSTELIACIGAAFPTINFHRKSEKEMLSKTLIASAIGLLLVIAAAALIILNGKSEYDKAIRRKNSLEAQKSELENQAAGGLESEYYAAQERLANIVAADEATFTHNENWNEIMRCLEEYSVSDVIISSLSSSASELTMNLTVTGKDEAAKTLLQYQQIPYFSEVFVSSINESTDEQTGLKTVTFSLRCTYRNPAADTAGGEEAE